MVEKWIHITDSGGDPWILPIWSAVKDAVASGKVLPIADKIKSKLGLSISTRLDMLPRVESRINNEVNKIYKAVENYERKNISKSNTEGYAFNIDNDLKFNLLVDIDSLFFELNSVCEIMTTLFYEIYTNVGKQIERKDVGIKIKEIIEATGNSSSWFQNLVSHRNFFIHEAAPYFSVDITDGPGNYDWLIMKENLKTFKDNSKYINMSEITSIIEGFLITKPIIQQYLISLYKELP
jgi:hypothetical protein